MMTDDYWIVRDNVGIKTFPRAGSTTILNTYGYGQSVVNWMTCSERYVVVRNPWDRLLSAYALYTTKRYGSVPELQRLDDLLDYIINRPQEEIDVHCRSQHSQLQGYEPREGELVEMKYFLDNPPIQIQLDRQGLHRNQTMTAPPTLFTAQKYEWWKAINIKDFELFDRARKE